MFECFAEILIGMMSSATSRDLGLARPQGRLPKKLPEPLTRLIS